MTFYSSFCLYFYSFIIRLQLYHIYTLILSILYSLYRKFFKKCSVTLQSMNYFVQRKSVVVSAELKETLLEFSLCCLLQQPYNIIPYAKKYFEEVCDKQTEIVYDIRCDTTEESSEPVHSTVNEEDLYLPDDIPQDYFKKRTQVIYSEPYNPEKDADGDKDDVIYPKTEEQVMMLEEVVSKCLLFRSLDKEQIHRVISVMFPVEVQPEDVVIKQWDDGDFFYIIENGEYEVWIAPQKDLDPVHVFTYKSSGSFGELALLYNMPRAATIKATTAGRLWAMDRQTFRKIVLKAAFKKRKMYEDFIQNVPILEELTTYERMTLADAFVPKIVPDGYVIINQGDDADGMYFIEQGSCSVNIYSMKLGKQIEVATLKEGDYFGELALITHKPRAATVVAKGEVKLAFVDVDTFERVLGPCVKIMKRNINTYQQIILDLDSEELSEVVKQAESIPEIRQSIAAIV